MTWNTLGVDCMKVIPHSAGIGACAMLTSRHVMVPPKASGRNSSSTCASKHRLVDKRVLAITEGSLRMYSV